MGEEVIKLSPLRYRFIINVPWSEEDPITPDKDKFIIDKAELVKVYMEKEGFLAPETHVNVELIIQFPNPNKK